MYKGKRPFSRQQLIFVVDTIMTAAWDRIASTLPDMPSDIPDFMQNRQERLSMVHGYRCVVAAALPILYARLTDDGMGIGEFDQFEMFERMVDSFIKQKTDPNRKGKWQSHPGSRDLAESFVDQFFDEYIEKHWGKHTGNPDFCPTPSDPKEVGDEPERGTAFGAVATWEQLAERIRRMTQDERKKPVSFREPYDDASNFVGLVLDQADEDMRADNSIPIREGDFYLHP